MLLNLTILRHGHLSSGHLSSSIGLLLPIPLLLVRRHSVVRFHRLNSLLHHFGRMQLALIDRIRQCRHFLHPTMSVLPRMLTLPPLRLDAFSSTPLLALTT